MGIRINKDIGYFLPSEDIDKILVSNYQEILENLDSEDGEEEVFFKKLIHSLENSEDSIDKIILAKSYQDKFDKKDLQYFHLVNEPLFGDDTNGVLFRTQDHYKNSRHDDLIDYYESEENLDNSINYLYKAIYPTQGFIYKGGITDEKILADFDKYNKPLKISDSYDYFYVKIILNQLGFKLDDVAEGQVSKAIVESGLFYPKVDSVLYLTAKAANILKPDITKEIFDATVKPAILTYWC